MKSIPIHVINQYIYVGYRNYTEIQNIHYCFKTEYYLLSVLFTVGKLNAANMAVSLLLKPNQN